ncbi:hypothetical protein CK203_032521 [Vitis vinifera]|uniref:Uncharacterized protein n=1 Tax=Vitis vinifera TaxID=29760 RepID=A0A438I6G0_VITVI|nr:hypothetical protein CK203_032521 [Vitis vinifera]
MVLLLDLVFVVEIMANRMSGKDILEDDMIQGRK